MPASTETIETAVTSEDVVCPSPAVAVAAGRVLHDLAGLRAAKGEEVARIEAMAMLNAAVAFLRPRLGDDGVQRMKDLLAAAGDRIERRDAGAAAFAGRRAAAARAKKNRGGGER